MSSHRILHLDEAETVPVLDGSLDWIPLRRRLGVRAFGTNAYRADAGRDVVEAHDESGGHEELYVVIRGRATFTVDGESFDAPAGTVVFLPEPAAQRHARAEEDGTLVLAAGGWPDRAFELL